MSQLTLDFEITVVEIPQAGDGVECREIPDYPGYAVGDNGTAWSCHNNKWGLSTIWNRLALSTTEFGYHSVTLSRNGDHSTKLVHQLVLTAFSGPRPSESHECRHMDGVPSNNRIGNLKWGTWRENYDDRKRHGTDQFGEKNTQAVLVESQVVEIRVRYAAGGVRQVDLAKEFGVSKRAISKISRGIMWPDVGGPRTDGSSRRFRFTAGHAIKSPACAESPQTFEERLARVGITAEVAAQIETSHSNGTSFAQLARDFGCSERMAKLISQRGGRND